MTNPRESDQPTNNPAPRSQPRYGQGPRGGAAQYGSEPPVATGGGDYGEQEPTPKPTPAPTTGYPQKPSRGRYGKQAPPPDDSYEATPTEPPATPEPADPNASYGPEDPDYGTGGAETPGQPSDGYPPEPHPCPPSMTCDTGAIDDLQCEASGVKAEADKLAEVATALATRRTAFNTARAEYSKARDEAAKSVKELRRRLNGLEIDTKCLLTPEEIGCVDEAFGQVEDCLDECTTTHGCCVEEDCGFDTESWTVSQMEDLAQRVIKIEKCFDEDLVKEPAALTQRVTDVQKLIDDLATAMKDPTDPTRLYVQVKEARRALDTVWGNFNDVNDFQNCLCCGLTCSLKGRQVLAQLAGDKAYAECQEASRQKRCEWLRKNIVEETLAVLLIVCPPDGPCHEDDGATQPTTA